MRAELQKAGSLPVFLQAGRRLCRSQRQLVYSSTCATVFSPSQQQVLLLLQWLLLLLPPPCSAVLKNRTETLAVSASCAYGSSRRRHP